MGRTFEKLDAWKHAIGLATLIYGTTKGLPKDEIYGLISQIRRAVISIERKLLYGLINYLQNKN